MQPRAVKPPERAAWYAPDAPPLTSDLLHTFHSASEWPYMEQGDEITATELLRHPPAIFSQYERWRLISLRTALLRSRSPLVPKRGGTVPGLHVWSVQPGRFSSVNISCNLFHPPFPSLCRPRGSVHPLHVSQKTQNPPSQCSQATSHPGTLNRALTLNLQVYIDVQLKVSIKINFTV